MSGTNNWLSELKLRVSYGVTGNQAISPYQTQGTLIRTTYSFDETTGFGYRPQTLANKELKWESTSVINLGLDFSLFKGRISGNIDVYDTDTYDLLMYRKLPITTGFDQILENVGSTNNKGFEVSLHSINIDRGGLTWSSDLSIYSNHTKIVELYNGKEDYVGDRWFIGQPIKVYYDYEKVGIWQLGEESAAAVYGETVGQIKVKDQNNDDMHNSDDMIILGNNEPDFVANFANNITYKNWDAGISMYFRIGGMTDIGSFAPYSKKRYNKLNFDYWTPENPTNEYPRPNQLYDNAGGLWGTTLRYRDASYIKVSNVSIGYTFPESIIQKIKLSRARAYVAVENPWYWTRSEMKKFNMRPDWAASASRNNISTDYGSGYVYGGMVGGGDIQTWPATRIYTVGINLSF
jgi:hypothetical protein